MRQPLMLLVAAILCCAVVRVTSLSASAGTVAPPPTSSGPLSFIHVSDIHFDPTYNPCSQVSDFCRGSNVLQQCHPMGQFGCDSPESLVNSLIANMKLTTPNPAFIVVSGDSAAHDLTESDTLASVRYVMATMQNAFPGVPVYPVVGNNDCYPKNSLPIGPSSYLSTLSSMLSSSSILPPTVWNSFQRGGYYSHSPTPGLLLLGINSVYWYKKWISFDTRATVRQAQPFLDTLDSDSKLGYYVLEELEEMGINASTLSTDPANQLSWLNTSLAAAVEANQMCILVWHVGLGTSATGGDLLWESNFYSSFVSIYKQYASHILVMLSGHTHRDFFNLLYDTGTSSGKLLGVQLLPGALTPRDDSFPSYRAFSLSANLSELLDYSQYVWLPDEQAWDEHYQFSVATNGLAPTPAGMQQVYQNMAAGKWPPDSDYTVCTYMNAIWAGGSECIWSQSDETCPCQDMFCSITETDSKKLSDCVSSKPKAPACPSSNNCNIASEFCVTI